MAYDEKLNQRLRNALKDIPEIAEKRMMGGICFLLNGNMIGGADRQKNGSGRFMFRVGKKNEAEALSRPGSSIMKQGGRRMSGLIFVDSEICDEQTLSAWVSLALDFVQSLPPK